MYMAPEVFRSEPYNEKADVFSFGIMLYEVRGRNRPSGAAAGFPGACRLPPRLLPPAMLLKALAQPPTLA